MDSEAICETITEPGDEILSGDLEQAEDQLLPQTDDPRQAPTLRNNSR